MAEATSQQELLRRIARLEQENAKTRRTAQENLRRNEAQYQAMLESVDAHMTLVDRNLDILWANEKAKKIFGRDIVGKPCCEAFYGRKEPCCDPSSCLTRQAFRNGSSARRQSMKMKAKNGKGMFFEGSARVVSWDSDGNPSAVVKIYKDITGRKLAEEELRRNMKQMRKQ
jgi:PAS domain S-box-containing protein